MNKLVLIGKRGAVMVLVVFYASNSAEPKGVRLGASCIQNGEFLVIQ